MKIRAVALGLFDGVHLGHREVIKYPVQLEKYGFIPSVFTFKNSSLSEKQGRSIEYIYTDVQKESIIKDLGIKEIFSEDFNTIKDLNGEEFVREILIKKVNAGYVICGNDFKFGKRASCGIRELSELGKKYDFKVKIADNIKLQNEIVSSRKIRGLISIGYISSANLMLGSDYHIDGEVVHGRQLGRTLNFPTINQVFEPNQLVPKKGVYQSSTEIDGILYESITNIGIKPTVGAEVKPLSETHILNFSNDIYGKNIKVTLKRFIRDEKKFASVQELRSQIFKDIDSVKNK
ncbi:MAG: bifunctional riboflavin kinase/FAD synthetase [Oscillospiraceae bacterium]|nr:bifunctional riboflavin kinase/FAD synthetase [Oscillospiraceae bacterium]